MGNSFGIPGTESGMKKKTLAPSTQKTKCSVTKCRVRETIQEVNFNLKYVLKAFYYILKRTKNNLLGGIRTYAHKVTYWTENETQFSK